MSETIRGTKGTFTTTAGKGGTGGVRIEALALDYDGAAWEREFLANWPADSPAHVSYFRRMIAGPDYSLAQAQGTKPMLAPGQFACECNAAET